MHKDVEIAALETCFQALDTLSPEAQQRVLQWLNGRFQQALLSQTDTSDDTSLLVGAHDNLAPAPANAEGGNVGEQTQAQLFILKTNNLQEIGNCIRFVTESEKALLMAAYIQNAQHHAEITSRMINDYLKKFDEGIKNITSALRVLIQKNPPLIIQTHKAGQVAQAQKKYQVTSAGFAYVNALLAQNLK